MAEYEDYEDRRETSIGTTRSKNGFVDPAGVYPKREYVDKASTNEAARGIRENKLYMGGGDKYLNLDIKKRPSSIYPLNQVRETVSGHITEVDDTPGAERMLFRHRTGAGIELSADGSVLISSRNNTIRVTGGDEKVIIEGDGHIIYNGNLTMNVSGDFDLKVGGNYNLTVANDKSEQIDGASVERVEKNLQSTVVKNRAFYTIGTESETILGDKNSVVKGGQNNYVQGNVSQFIGQTYTLTTQDEIVVTAPNINMSAESLTVIGDSGTVGGENIIMYNYNMYTGHSIEAVDTITTATTYSDRVNSTSMHATTFHGDLTGRADTAIASDTAIYASYGGGPGGPAGWTNTDTTEPATVVDTTATVLPTTAIISDYLTKSSKGVRDVQIDPSDSLKNQIDRINETGGISTRKLTTAEVRSKLRDPKTLANEAFVASAVSQGVLNPSYVLAIPAEIGRIVGSEPGVGRNTKSIGNTSGDRSRGFTR